MNILFRTDASPLLGTGHVMRCLALAEACQELGGAATFLLASITPAIEQLLSSHRISVTVSPTQPGSANDAWHAAKIAIELAADWVVIDGIAFGEAYQKELKSTGLRLLVLDDHAASGHWYADLILNQNYGVRAAGYENREPNTELFLGPRFALLRQEFGRWRDWHREVTPQARRVLITMGGSDPDNLTLQIVKAIATHAPEMEMTVVVGPSNPHVATLRAVTASVRCDLVVNATNISDLMAKSELAVIVAGGTLWELLFMEVATLSYARDALQDEVVNALLNQRVIHHLGSVSGFDAKALVESLRDLAGSKNRRRSMGMAGRQIVDGLGAFRMAYALRQTSLSTPRSITMQ